MCRGATAIAPPRFLGRAPRRMALSRFGAGVIALSSTAIFLRARSMKISALDARLLRLDQLHQDLSTVAPRSSRPGAAVGQPEAEVPPSKVQSAALQTVAVSLRHDIPENEMPEMPLYQVSSAFDCCALCLRKDWCRSWMWRKPSDTDMGPTSLASVSCELHGSIATDASGTITEIPSYPRLTHRPTALGCQLCPVSAQEATGPTNSEPETEHNNTDGNGASTTSGVNIVGSGPGSASDLDSVFLRHLTIAIPTVARDEAGLNTYLNRTVSRLLEEISNHNYDESHRFRSVSLIVFSHSADHASFDKLRIRVAQFVESFGVPNLSAISFLSDGNLLSRLDPHRSSTNQQFDDKSPADAYHPPGDRVRQQGLDFLALLRAVIADSAVHGLSDGSVLLTEDDMLPCPGTLKSIARLTSQLGHFLPPTSTKHTRWMLRSGGGLAGAVLPLSALPDIHDFMSKYYTHRPNDHLLFEWGAGQWEAEDNERAGVRPGFAPSPVAVFRTRENMWEHIGHQSSLGHSTREGSLQCGRWLEDASCYERFQQQCEAFGLSPCHAIK